MSEVKENLSQFGSRVRMKKVLPKENLGKKKRKKIKKD